MSDTPPCKTRLDKWLWHARFFKTRSLATKQVVSGRVRVNGKKVLKPGHGLSPGDTLTLAIGNRVRVIRVLAPSTRRGPAPEAQCLYFDVSSEAVQTPPAPPKTPGRDRTGARPTGKDRRARDLSRRDHLE